MTKRVIAILMCVVMLLASAPISSLAEYTDFAIQAFAAEQHLKVTVAATNVYVGRSAVLVPIATYDGTVVSSGVTYTWESADESVATVGSDGTVTGISEGQTDIIVTASYLLETVTIYRSVTVVEYKPVTSLTYLTETINMTAGQSAELYVTIAPTTATVKSLTWTSSDPSVLEVISTGVYEDSSRAYASVQALAEGTVTLSFVTTDGTAKRGSFTIDVKPQISSLTLPASLVLTMDSVNQKIEPIILPTNAGNKNLKWTSTNEAVCMVDYKGSLVPKGYGTCYISAATSDGSNLTRSTYVIVSDGTRNITLDKTSAALTVGGADLDLTATCTTPTFSYVDAVTWISSDPSVATVDSLGIVTAVGPGTANITATTADGTNLSAVCSVSVTQPVTGISLPEEIKCWLGENTIITPTFIPSNASNKKVTWASSDVSVAEISPEGMITGKKVGTSVITVTTDDGGYVATCLVSVEIKPTNLVLSSSSLTLKVGDINNSSKTLTATVEPANATNKAVTWTSSNPAVATVDANGKVTAVAGGTATVTCETVSGGVEAYCSVVVYEDETGVEILNVPVASLFVSQTHKLSAAVYPSTATTQTVTWTSSNPGVVYIDQSGNITARAVGSSVITATTTNKGLTATCTIFVVDKINVTGVTLNKETATVTNGDKVYLVATVSPSNASNKAVSWKSSNTTVATVDATGAVTAKAPGTALITVTTNDGNHSAYCTVMVTQPVTGLTLNKSKTTIGVGSAETLVANILPANATNKAVAWSSSNTAVATVDSNGKVTALKAGTTVITAVSREGGFTSECTVTVIIPVTGVKLNASSVTVPKGETRVVTKTISPANASIQSVTWSTSNASIVTVSATGLIKGIRTGTATVTVTTDDGKYQAHIDVKVIQPVTGLSLNYSSVILDAGKKKTLTATIRPLTASDKTVKWTSSDTKIATVDSTGKITAVSAGTATITCTSGDGYCSATCKVTVTQPPTGIQFAKKSVNVSIGTPKKLTVTVLPENASNKNVVWKSENPKIATVSEDGTVKGLKKGTAKITATTANGLYTATITVNVLRPVKSVSLNKTSITIAVGKTTVITPTVKPKSASNKQVIWKSSDNDVLTVSKTGKITAKSAGYAVVTCTTVDGNKTAECSVFVNQPVSSLKLNKSKITIDIDKKFTLKATLKPTTASNKALRWTSSNKKVAKVTAKGVIKPVSTGTAVITVTTLDGGFKATCKVTVVKKVKDVSLPESLTVFLGEKGSLIPVFTPDKPTNSTVTWKTSKKKIATVKDGVITPKKLGKTVITVRTEDGGFTDTCKVTVKRAIKSISLKKKSVTLANGGTYTLKVTKKPANATEAIRYKSSNKNVAVVSSKGVITAKGRGTATITAVTEKGKKVNFSVTVTQPVTSMYISRKTADVYLGETMVLTANVLPRNANNQAFTWSSSNTAVATVSNGTVTPKALGTAVITVKSANGKTATCTVTVKQHVTSVSLDKTSVSIVKGNTHTLKVTVLPANASEKGCNFSSSDASVATVSDRGVITAVAPGTAKITVTSKENGKTASCSVTVIEKVLSVSLNTTAETLYVDKDGVGQILYLSATVSPSNATNKNVSWSSSDSSVASVDSKGTVTAKKSGVAVITATSADGKKTASCTVTVLQNVSGITLEESISLSRGSTYMLKANVLPADAYNKNVTWITEHEGIATVNEYGIVTGVAVGNTVITAVTVDGSFRASCRVCVTEPVTGVSLDTEEIPPLYTGETYTLTATVYPDFVPDEIINKKLIWSSSDTSIATVENGVVTAVGGGEAVITVTTVDGGFTDSCKVTCLIPVSEIVTDKDAYYIPVGSECNIIATVLPENASYPQITWEIVTGGEYFTLDDQGKVTALETGNGLVRITSVDNPSVTKDVEIHTVKRVESVGFEITEKTLNKGETYTLIPTVLPADAYDKSVTYESDDETVVSVDENGTVTAMGRGTATVTATTVDGGFTAQCTFTVNQLVEEIVIAEGDYTVGAGSTLILETTVLPENANDKSLTWESSNNLVATVNNGTVTAVSAGETVITATAVDSGKISASVTVTVIQYAEEIILQSDRDSLWVGDSVSLTATVMPEDTTDKGIVFTSSDESIATVDENGTVTAVSAGDTGSCEVTIKAVSVCSNAQSEYVFTVKQQVTEINFGQETIFIQLGEKTTLTPEVLPENAFDKTITYKSDDESIVAVEGNSLVAVAMGKVTVTATSACGKAEKQCSVEVVVLPDGIEMETEISLEKTKTYSLNPVLTPENTTLTDITFSSSDESVATVDENGLVTALKGGTAVITAQTAIEGIFAQCLVNVFVNSEEVVLNCSEHSFYAGETLQLTANVLPEDTTNKNITFASSDVNVATVDENGLVTAVDAGTATIVATAEDTGLTAICKVSVLRHVENIAFAQSEAVAYEGREVNLEIIFTPANATNKNIIWSSKDTRIVSVNEEGKLIANMAGTTVVTAESEDGGYKAVCFVEVITGIDSVTLNKTSLLMDKGSTETLTCEILPTNAKYKDVIWSSSDETVVTVDQNGVVTATDKAGEAVIRATAADNEKAYGECIVTVREPLEAVYIEQDSIGLRVNETQQLTVIYYPTNATVRDVVFTVADEAVATVDENGVVTAVAPGETTVTVTAADGGYTVECTVKVYLEIEEIVAGDYTINTGTTAEAPVAVFPVNHDETLIYSSSDETVATVDENGIITAKAPGTSVITVTGSISGITHSFTVTVKQPVTSVSFRNEAETVNKGGFAELAYDILPVDADNIISIEFSSSDETVAKIIFNEDGVAEGKVQGLKAGTAVITITVTTEDGIFTDECVISVTE